jgi:methyl coenzyme M reductase subunit D
MGPFTNNRLKSSIERGAAEFFEKEFRGRYLITIIGMQLANNMKRGALFISLLPEQRQAEFKDIEKETLHLLHNFLKTKIKRHTLPSLRIEITSGVSVDQ